MKKTVLKVVLACILALSFGPAVAQQLKKILAIVVKGLDNPFFEQINLGCQKWHEGEPELRIHLLLHWAGLQRRRGR